MPVRKRAAKRVRYKLNVNTFPPTITSGRAIRNLVNKRVGQTCCLLKK